MVLGQTLLLHSNHLKFLENFARKVVQNIVKVFGRLAKILRKQAYSLQTTDLFHKKSPDQVSAGLGEIWA